MTHLGVVYRHHPVTAHSILQTYPIFRALDILKQQPPQQFGRLHYPLASSPVLIQQFLRLPAQLQQPVTISRYLSKQRCASGPVVPVYAGLTLHACGHIPLVSVRRRPLSKIASLKFRKRSHQLHDSIRKKVVGVLHRAAAQNIGRVQRHLHPATLQVSCLPRKPQAALEHLSRLLMQYQARPKQLKRTLGERPGLHLDTQRHLPAYVEVRSLLGLGIARPIIGLKKQRRCQKTRRHAVSAVVSAVQFREVLVSKQLSTQRGQQAVETPTSHVLYVQTVGSPKPSLVGLLSQHSHSPLSLIAASIVPHSHFSARLLAGCVTILSER